MTTLRIKESECPFVVPVPSKVPTEYQNERIDWVRDHFPERDWVLCWNLECDVDQKVYKFRHEKDAMLFALKWSS